MCILQNTIPTRTALPSFIENCPTELASLQMTTLVSNTNVAPVQRKMISYHKTDSFHNYRKALISSITLDLLHKKVKNNPSLFIIQ